MKRYTLCKFCFAALLLLFLLTWKECLPGTFRAELPDGMVTAVGTVSRIEEKESSSGQKQILLSLRSAVFCSGHSQYKTEWKKASGILCKIKEEQSELLLPGEHIVVRGEAESFRRSRNPGGFDEEAYYRSSGICFSLEEAAVIHREQRKGVLQSLSLCRRYMTEVLIKVCGEDSGIMRAMLLGDKTCLDADTKRLYQNGGISHILAISGVHISFLGIGLYRFLRRLYVPPAAAGSVSAMLLLSYVVMTGASPSACRAGAMFVCSLFAELIGRSYERLTALSFSALVFAAVHPFWLKQSGFYLSYGAVLGLELIYPILAELWEGKVVRLFTGGLSVTVITLPVLLLSFFEFPVSSFFLNLFVIPLMSLVMAFGVLALLAGMVFLPFGKILFLPVHIILKIFEVSCWLSEQLPGCRWVMGAPSYLQLFLYVVPIIVLVTGRKYMTKACALLLLICSLWMIHMPLLCTASVTVLDVGQGDGIVLRGKDGTCAMIDGGSSSEKKVGQYTLLPYLKSRKMTELDFVFLTHMDDDHVNGIEELIEMGAAQGIHIRCLVMPELSRQDEDYRRIAGKALERGIDVRMMGAGERISAGDFVFDCLHPQEESGGEDRNAASLVLYVRNGMFDALFMGDIDGEAEKELIKTHMLPCQVTLLKVGHHGSKASSSSEFLELVRPKIAVISCGENNRYGHPDQETLKRLRSFGCRIWTTPECGAVTLEAGKSVSVHGYRKWKTG